MVKGDYKICEWCKMLKFLPEGKDICSDCWTEETGIEFNYSYPENITLK